MSTMTGVGLPIVLDGPLPKPHPYNLFTVAQELGGRWNGGVGLWAHPTDVPSGHDPCLDGTFREKDEPGDGLTAIFEAFEAYVGFQCSAMGMGNWQDFQARVNRVMEAADAYAAERQLAFGDPRDDQPYLIDTNLDQIATGVSPQAGLSYLEQAIGETGRAGVIHADPATASSWTVYGGLTPVGDQLRTWLGTPVVVGTGYIGADPAGGSTLGAGESWAFATGPLVYGRSETIELAPTAAETVDRSNNDVIYRAERDILVAWDTALQAGVQIDWAS